MLVLFGWKQRLLWQDRACLRRQKSFRPWAWGEAFLAQGQPTELHTCALAPSSVNNVTQRLMSWGWLGCWSSLVERYKIVHWVS